MNILDELKPSNQSIAEALRDLAQALRALTAAIERSVNTRAVSWSEVEIDHND